MKYTGRDSECCAHNDHGSHRRADRARMSRWRPDLPLCWADFAMSAARFARRELCPPRRKRTGASRCRAGLPYSRSRCLRAARSVPPPARAERMPRSDAAPRHTRKRFRARARLCSETGFGRPARVRPRRQAYVRAPAGDRNLAHTAQAVRRDTHRAASQTNAARLNGRGAAPRIRLHKRRYRCRYHGSIRDAPR